MGIVPDRGFLLIADLTGYTAYLTRSEIEHAPAIAGDLLETVIGRLEPPFRLAKLEGDAAFLFVEDGRADGSLLLDAVEAAYVAFRRRLRSIEQATTCDCNACSQAPRLDLKLFLHHGEYVRRPIAGRDELAGSSIIVVHRLLKGTVARGLHAADGTAAGFAVVTDDAIAALGVGGLSLAGARGEEAVEGVGDIGTLTIDLEARWQVEADRRRVDIPEDRAALDVRTILPAKPATAWAFLTAPALRPAWEGPIVITEQEPASRRGSGTRSQCVTGRLATLEEVVDWQPYEHVAYRLAVPDLGPVEATFDLEPVAGGTVVRLRWSMPGGSAVTADALDRHRRDRHAALRRLARAVSTAEEEVA